MLNSINQQMEIAVRLYDNAAYGTTYGKGKYRKAILNGTVDVRERDAKYLVDFYNYEDWVNQAKSDEQMEILANVDAKSEVLYSWVKHYDPSTQAKTPVTGVCQIDLDSLDMTVLIFDEPHGVADTWRMGAKPCKVRTGVKSPQLLATNTDLGAW